jgi:hypothetical protein
MDDAKPITEPAWAEGDRERDCPVGWEGRIANLAKSIAFLPDCETRRLLVLKQEMLHAEMTRRFRYWDERRAGTVSLGA